MHPQALAPWAFPVPCCSMTGRTEHALASYALPGRARLRRAIGTHHPRATRPPAAAWRRTRSPRRRPHRAATSPSAAWPGDPTRCDSSLFEILNLIFGHANSWFPPALPSLRSDWPTRLRSRLVCAGWSLPGRLMGRGRATKYARMLACPWRPARSGCWSQCWRASAGTRRVGPAGTPCGARADDDIRSHARLPVAPARARRTINPTAAPVGPLRAPWLSASAGRRRRPG